MDGKVPRESASINSVNCLGAPGASRCNAGLPPNLSRPAQKFIVRRCFRPNRRKLSGKAGRVFVSIGRAYTVARQAELSMLFNKTRATSG